MIYKIEVKGLRALKYINITLDPFMVMVGPNACGKSTLFDALLFVRDILAGGLEAAVLGNLRLDITPRALDALDLTWLRQGETIEIAITLKLPDAIVKNLDGKYQFARYELGIETHKKLAFTHEALWLHKKEIPQQRLDLPEETAIIDAQGINGWRKIIGKTEEGNHYFRSEITDWNTSFRLGVTKNGLANLPEDESRFSVAVWVKRILLEGIHRLMLNAEKMRLPSSHTGLQNDFLADGSNLPWVIHALESSDPERKTLWIEHLQTSLIDLKDITTVIREEDRSCYIVLHYQNGLKAPSWLLSDGTLRLLALTLLAYAPKAPALILIEEPENGIHPKAIETVMQSLQSVYDSQILCATHSPIVLSQLSTKQILCFTKQDDGAVDIIRGDKHPQLQGWKSTLNLGDLLATGVLG